MATIKEPATGKEFEAELDNHDALLGCGVRVKKIVFVVVNIYALGIYMDKDGLKNELAAYKGKSKEALAKDQAFFDKIVSSDLSKSFVLIMARDVTGAQLTGALGETLTPRLKDQKDLKELEKLLANASFKENTRVQFALSPEGKFTVSVDGKELGSISSPDLCKAIVRVYFDSKCVDASLRANLVQRVPEILGA